LHQKNTNAYPERPRVGVGAVVIHDEKVLLVKRAGEPNKGLWAIPGGTLKIGETMREGAAREILEETGITVAVGECIYVFDLIERDPEGKIKFQFVVVDFAALYVRGEPKGADDAEEAGWFGPEEFSDLPVSENTLKILHSTGFLNS